MAGKRKAPTEKAAPVVDETTDQRRFRERMERRQALRVAQKIAPADSK